MAGTGKEEKEVDKDTRSCLQALVTGLCAASPEKKLEILSAQAEPLEKALMAFGQKDKEPDTLSGMRKLVDEKRKFFDRLAGEKKNLEDEANKLKEKLAKLRDRMQEKGEELEKADLELKSSDSKYKAAALGSDANRQGEQQQGDSSEAPGQGNGGGNSQQAPDLFETLVDKDLELLERGMRMRRKLGMTSNAKWTFGVRRSAIICARPTGKRSIKILWAELVMRTCRRPTTDLFSLSALPILFPSWLNWPNSCPLDSVLAHR